MPRTVMVALVGVLLLGGRASALAQPSAPQAVLIEIDGPLTQASAEYRDRGLRAPAGNAGWGEAAVVILQIDTPGGSIDVMNRMVQAIRGSSVPVVVYVAPRGAIAGSAGTILVLAGHAAAMAPETAIGAASPVGAQGEDLDQTLAAKTREIMKATARTLAGWRGPAALELAQATIDEAAAASSQEALAVGMIDVIADDPEDLLRQLDGRSVEVAGQPVVLHLAEAQAESIPPTLVERLPPAPTHPQLVFLLLSLPPPAPAVWALSP